MRTLLKIFLWLIFSIFTLILLTFITLMALITLRDFNDELISDQAMIDHFNAHKEEFNALVKNYGVYGANSEAWAMRPEVIELKEKTGIERIIDGPGYWFDDPYSIESAIKLKEMDNEKSWSQYHSRSTALIKMEDSMLHEATYFWNGIFNWKDYVYIPVTPSIEQGRMKFPRRVNDGNEPHLWLRVLESLDSPKWDMGECVLRKIEPQWFLIRCRSR